MNELGDQAGQHEVIAENLSTQVVQELNTLVKQLKDDRRKVRRLRSKQFISDRKCAHTPVYIRIKLTNEDEEEKE